MAGEVWTIGSILKWTEQYFGTKGVESPRLDAEVLLSHVPGLYARRDIDYRCG